MRQASQRLLPLLLLALLSACDSRGPAPNPTDTPVGREFTTGTATEPGLRSLPDLACPEDYAGTTGLLTPTLLDPAQYSAVEGGAEAPSEVAARLPRTVHLRGARQSYDGTYWYAVDEGRIYLRANRETTGIDEPWRILVLPRCLDGQVREISADGTVLLALDAKRQIYTLDYANGAIGAGG